jgi:hypothetical protein
MGLARRYPRAASPMRLSGSAGKVDARSEFFKKEGMLPLLTQGHTAMRNLACSFVIAAASWIWSGPSMATCHDTHYELPATLDTPQNEKNIETILNFGRCERAEHKDRVGKWSCAVSTKGAVIQKDSSGAAIADIIPVDTDKFFVTISELPEFKKAAACKYEFFGINYTLSGWHKNLCLANYEIEFSPPFDFFIQKTSPDSYIFGNINAAFALYGVGGDLYGVGVFIMIRTIGTSSYTMSGMCEKVH